MSRPSLYTAEIADEICEKMSEGKGLREICEAEHLPSRGTVLRWAKDNGEFRNQYELARDARWDWLAEEAIKIADDASGDYFIEDRSGQSIVVPDHARVQRARLQVDTRKWLLSKVAPTKYGDKVELLTASKSSEAEGDPTKIVIRCWPSIHLIVYPMLDDQGKMLTPGSPEHDAALEAATQEIARREESGELRITDVRTGLGPQGNRTAVHAEIGFDLKRDEAPAPPRAAQITYQPAPLPADLTAEDWSLLTEVLDLIKRTIPSDAQNPPAEIMGIIREALLEHFRTGAAA